jgi:hypothetical protein
MQSEPKKLELALRQARVVAKLLTAAHARARAPTGYPWSKTAESHIFTCIANTAVMKGDWRARYYSQ